MSTEKVTKRRAGKAPEGSGVPVGTEYHWYMPAHQHARKLNANDYTTALTGLKYKLAHKRADNNKWNISDKAQRKNCYPQKERNTGGVKIIPQLPMLLVFNK